MATDSLAFAFLKACAMYGIRQALSDRKRLVEAADKFWSAFTECKLQLDTSDEDPYEVIKPYLESQKLAVAEFSRFLRPSKQSAFRKAWEAYYSYPNIGSQPFPEKYFAAGNIGKKRNQRKKASQRIERLLSFAPTY